VTPEKDRKKEKAERQYWKQKEKQDLKQRYMSGERRQFAKVPTSSEEEEEEEESKRRKDRKGKDGKDGKKGKRKVKELEEKRTIARARVSASDKSK
jgi:hypothetical protein